MRALLVVALCSHAHAQPVRRAPLVWKDLILIKRPAPERGWIVGSHATSEQLDSELGYHVTDRFVVRGRLAARAVETAYAFGAGKMMIPDAMRTKLFVLAGFDADPYGGLSLRTYPIQGADFATLELGVRVNHARTEGFVSIALLLDPLARFARTTL